MLASRVAYMKWSTVRTTTSAQFFNINKVLFLDLHLQGVAFDVDKCWIEPGVVRRLFCRSRMGVMSV
jgi:hypothetical protein